HCILRIANQRIDTFTTLAVCPELLDPISLRARCHLTDGILRSNHSGGSHPRFPRSASMAGRRYCLITPCRDEARYGRRTLESVLRQSMPPALWVIVDDGSKDGTPQILAEYAARLPFIRVLTRADRGDRKLGGGVIDAFYTGYDTIDSADFTYVCKLDLDLDLPPRYFELLIERMEAEPSIWTCSSRP